MAEPIVHQVIRLLRVEKLHTRDIHQKLTPGSNVSITALRDHVMAELEKWNWVRKVRMNRDQFQELLAKEKAIADEAVAAATTKKAKKAIMMVSTTPRTRPKVWELNTTIVRPGMPGTTVLPEWRPIVVGRFTQNPPHICADLAGRSIADPPLIVKCGLKQPKKVPVPGEGNYLGIRIPSVRGRRKAGKAPRRERVLAQKARRDALIAKRCPPTTEAGIQRRALLETQRLAEEEKKAAAAEAEKDDWVRNVPPKRGWAWKQAVKAAKYKRQKEALRQRMIDLAEGRKQAEIDKFLTEKSALDTGGKGRVATVAAAVLAKKEKEVALRAAKLEAKKQRRVEHKGNVKARKESKAQQESKGEVEGSNILA